MNETAMDETQSNVEIIGEARKGPTLVLKVSVAEYYEKTYIYCQTWEKDKQDAGPGKLTHLGLTMRPDTLRDLLPLFQAALEKATARETRKARKVATMPTDPVVNGPGSTIS